MGAFDGYTSGFTTTYTNESKYKYYNGQPSFSFFKGFCATDLIALLLKAEKEDKATVYVPKGPLKGSINFDTWYIRAFVNKHFKELI